MDVHLQPEAEVGGSRVTYDVDLHVGLWIQAAAGKQLVEVKFTLVIEINQTRYGECK